MIQRDAWFMKVLWALPALEPRCRERTRFFVLEVASLGQQRSRGLRLRAQFLYLENGSLIASSVRRVLAVSASFVRILVSR